MADSARHREPRRLINGLRPDREPEPFKTFGFGGAGLPRFGAPGPPRRPEVPTRTPPPPNDDSYCPMDHLLFGASRHGGTHPSRSRGPARALRIAHASWRASERIGIFPGGRPCVKWRRAMMPPMIPDARWRRKARAALAGAHFAAKSAGHPERCFTCHSGEGVTGWSAVTALSAWDAARWVLGARHEPTTMRSRIAPASSATRPTCAARAAPRRPTATTSWPTTGACARRASPATSPTARGSRSAPSSTTPSCGGSARAATAGWTTRGAERRVGENAAPAV